MNSPEVQIRWEREFEPAPASSGVDFVSRDGRILIELQDKPQGMRGFYAGVMRLALELDRRPDAEIGCLVIQASKLSMSRLQDDWNGAKSVLGGKHARRLAIIAIQEPEVWTDPKRDHRISELASYIADVPQLKFKQLENSYPIRTTRKTDEVIKVLISRWLQNDAPIGIRELGDVVGCSYPTVSKTLKGLEATQHLRRVTGSTVELTRFPESDWKRIVALATINRNTVRFVDHSGQKPNTKSLLLRLKGMKPDNVAIGGVVAGRHWDPNFDLNGIPRLDLSIHETSQSLDFGFMKKLDPALRPTRNQNESPVVVIHTIGRANPGFTLSKKHTLPLADPVETALDLIEMGLVSQASQLLSSFRKEVRYS